MKSIIKQLLKEGLAKKNYIGQCDSLRRKSEENEAYWHDMMKNKKPISFNTFLKNVNMNQMLDPDENPADYINDALRSDPDTATYVSNWGDKQVMFFQSAGFEFLFI